jgi:hypothetical protein
MILCVIPLLIRRALYVVGYGNCTQTGPHDCHGVYEISGFEGKTRRSNQNRPGQPEEGTKSHKGWPTVGTPGAPSR